MTCVDSLSTEVETLALLKEVSLNSTDKPVQDLCRLTLQQNILVRLGNYTIAIEIVYRDQSYL
jgi:hypothetical protein